MVHLFHRVGGWATCLIFIILLFSSSGCSLWRTDKFILPADQSEEILLDEVPFFQQETYQCGPSSLAMVLAWTGLEVTPNELAIDVFAPNIQGSSTLSD